MKTAHKKINIIVYLLSRYVIGTFLLASILFPSVVVAGKWRVAPVHIYLDRRATSCVITISNDGEQTVNLQGKAMEWSQDEAGKDVYQETGDLLFFPRILTLEKGEEKIIRAGLKVPAEAKEKTYRLFIEEIPQARSETSKPTQVQVLVRFGIPIFAHPIKDEQNAELLSVSMEKGIINALVGNTGNIHFRITEITAAGVDQDERETFKNKLSGWYLLAGASRLHSLTVPLDKCKDSEKILLSVETDTDIILNSSVNVEKSFCQP